MPVIQITGVVHQRQMNPRACWYTCLQMAVLYHQNRLRSCPANLRSPDTFPDMRSRFSAGSNPSWAEWRQWAQRCGFSAIDMSPTALGIYDLLSTRGPIVYSGTWGNSFNGHVVVLTGINTDSDNLSVDDPLETAAPVSKVLNTYFGQLTQSLWENPLFVY